VQELKGIGDELQDRDDGLRAAGILFQPFGNYYYRLHSIPAGNKEPVVNFIMNRINYQNLIK
jgi:hypothetical protein